MFARKYDLWVISNTLDFLGAAKTPGQNRVQNPWTAIFCSLWHGPNSDGKIEVLLIIFEGHGSCSH